MEVAEKLAILRRYLVEKAPISDRCDRKNLHAQLKGEVRALYAPVDDSVSHGAWMVMTSLAWNLKA